jgi:hypothetical protein
VRKLLAKKEQEEIEMHHHPTAQVERLRAAAE